MTETTHTAGAVQTSDAQKRYYAQASYAFNKNNRVFNRIFPGEMDSNIKKIIEKGIKAENKEVFKPASIAVEAKIGKVDFDANTIKKRQREVIKEKAIIPKKVQCEPIEISSDSDSDIEIISSSSKKRKWSIERVLNKVNLEGNRLTFIVIRNDFDSNTWSMRIIDGHYLLPICDYSNQSDVVCKRFFDTSVFFDHFF